MQKIRPDLDIESNTHSFRLSCGFTQHQCKNRIQVSNTFEQKDKFCIIKKRYYTTQYQICFCSLLRTTIQQDYFIIFTYCSLLRTFFEVLIMQKIRPDLDIGSNIRSLRLSCGFTQDMVVAKIQLMGILISRSTYAKIESNLMNIKVSELVALASIFNCEFNDFFANLN